MSAASERPNCLFPALLRALIACCLAAWVAPGLVWAQDDASIRIVGAGLAPPNGGAASSAPTWNVFIVSPETVESTHEEPQVSVQSDDLVGPAPAGDLGEIIRPGALPQIPALMPAVEVYSDESQQVPVLRVHGKYFDPSGLSAPGPLSEETNQAIRSRMLRLRNMGFRCFLLRVDWPGVAPEPNRVDAARVQELLSYADDLGLKVIISLELGRAPAWFFRGEGGSGRVMVSRLVDPEQERAMGKDGNLVWSNGTGVPLTYHPDTMREVSSLIYSLHYSLEDEPALLGWLISGPMAEGFPGGGREGVVGMCDYSPYTVNRYYEATGTPLMTYPLDRYSQGTWDDREDFRAFMELRLLWKREAFDAVIDAFKEVDAEHLILVRMDPVLSYRNDNGYLSEMRAPDATRQLVNPRVDGAVIGFQLASDTFDRLNVRSETSAMHLALTINQVARHGKIPLVAIEADSVNPPSTIDIGHLAYMIKAAGAYPIWCSGFLQRRGHRWSWREENAIERGQALSLLPAPKRLRRGEVGILDIPPFYSAFYAEQSLSLMLSLMQLAIHQRTGVLLEMVGVDELGGGQPVLQQYIHLIVLAPELLSSEDAKTWFEPHVQIALRGYQLSGVIEAVDPMLLHQYALEEFHSTVLEDQLRTRYVYRGAPADLLHGADAFIIANDPYVFIRINNLHRARYIDVKLAGWPEVNLSTIDVVDLPSGEPRRVEMISGSASFPFGPSKDVGHLFVLTDDYAPMARMHENRLVGVAIAQQARHMRRSVPAALLLAALLAVTLAWMTFQSQQRSLLQAAELVDRRRRIEPIDILEDAEVLAFYKEYLSEGGEESAEENGEAGSREPGE